jgi:translation initiation factor 3 subunit C
MSRFIGADTDSDSESSSSDSENGRGQDEGTQMNFGFDDSSSDEEVQRQVISVRDKRFNELYAVIGRLKNHLKIEDWVGTAKDFEDLKKALKKANPIVQREGVPKIYIKATLTIEAAIQAVTTARAAGEDTKMSQANNRAFNTCKMKMKKHHKEYETHIKAYMEDPLVSEDEDAKKSSGSDSDSSDSDSDSDSGSDKKKGSSSSDSDSSSEDWDTDVESDDAADVGDSKNMYSRAFWMKSPEVLAREERERQSRGADIQEYRIKSFTIQEDTLQVIIQSPREKLKLALSKASNPTVLHLKRKLSATDNVSINNQNIVYLNANLEDEKALLTLVRGRGGAHKKNAPKKEQKREEKELTPEQVLRKLKDLLVLLYKPKVNRLQVVQDLEFLSTRAKDPVVLIKIKVSLITAYMEMNLNKGVHMNITVWRKCLESLKQVLVHLQAHPNIRLSEDEEVEEKFDSESEAEDEVGSVVSGARETKRLQDRAARAAEEAKNTTVTYILGNFYSFLYRLKVEFTRSLQEIDPHTPEYVIRLRDRPSLTALCESAAVYYSSINKISLLCQCKHVHLELIYYFTDQKLLCERKAGSAPSRIKTSPVLELCFFLYEHADPRQKTHALLMHVYYLANHNYFEQARDLLLMSHIQDRINDADVATRILFNRGMAQLGLSAFRTGSYVRGFDCLADLHASQRIKELLGQGISRFAHERDLKQEKLEKKRQFPFHMHLNLDTLESVHLIGAMFAEVHNIAVGRRKVISKTFRRQYENNHRNAFNAPPENTRDLVMHATAALTKGDWKACLGFILNLRMWSSMPGVEEVKGYMVQAIKETALRMFLVVFGSSYVSISVTSLMTRFELSQPVIIRLTSRMMVQGDLEGVWDQPTGTLIMHTSQPTRLQRAALDYADKVVLFVEQNERLLGPAPHSFYGTKSDSKRWDRNNRKTKTFSGNFRDRR